MKTANLFLIGQNSRGQWIAQKQAGRCGGMFVSHAAALKFALMENGNRREHVITVPGEFFDVDPGKRRGGRASRFRRHLRFSFGPPLARLEFALERFKELITTAT